MIIALGSAGGAVGAITCWIFLYPKLIIHPITYGTVGSTGYSVTIFFTLVSVLGGSVGAVLADSIFADERYQPNYLFQIIGGFLFALSIGLLLGLYRLLIWMIG